MSERTEETQARLDLVAEKHAQARTLLNQHGIDLWLTFAREGSDVLLPFVMGSEGIVGVAALCIFADGPSVAIVADYDQGQVDGAFDIVTPYSLDWREPFQTLLKERNPATIAINYSPTDDGIDGITYGLYQLLVSVLEPIGMADRLVSSQPVSERVRSQKTAGEIERMRRACEITQRIFDDLTGMLRPGLTEFDIAEIVRERMATYDVGPSWDAAHCPAVFSSVTQSGHKGPGLTKIEAGMGVRLDFGVFYEGYASDLQRTWWILGPGETKAPDWYQRQFEAVRDGIMLAEELIRPGVTGVQVDTPVRQLVADRGFKFTHALGHQVGRKCHDGGMLLGPDNARYRDRSHGTIEAGMVFTLEPCIEMVGIEEDIVVRENGIEHLVPPQREIYLV